jgi:hypothetical protein
MDCSAHRAVTQCHCLHGVSIKCNTFLLSLHSHKSSDHYLYDTEINVNIDLVYIIISMF